MKWSLQKLQFVNRKVGETMPDREKVIKGLESLRDICNAKSNMAIGKGKIAWAGYANAAYDAITILKEQEAEIRQLKLALDIAKGVCKGISVEGR